MSTDHEDRDPLTELDALLTEDERRTVSVADHQAFRESLVPKQAADEIDELIADIKAAEPNREGVR